MTFNFKNGKMVAIIKKQGRRDNKIVLIDANDKDGYESIELDEDEKFEPVLDSDGRSITYICGASGSGKSTLARSLIDKFHVLFPESPIYMFSRLTTDPAFDDLESKQILTRIPINDDLVEKPVDIIKDMEEWSMIIFDDIDTVTDKKQLVALNNIKSQILEIGRHKNLYLIVTSHLITTGDRNATRTMMNEMSSLVIFPRGGGSAYQQRYALKNYLGMSNNQVDDILATQDSRWVLISKTYPQYILTEKNCYVI